MRSRLPTIIATAVALALLWLCGLAAMATLGGNAPLATLPSPATMTSCSTVRPSATLPHAPVVVLDACGKGVQRTATFITGDEWAAQFTFDCATADVFQAAAYAAGGVNVGALEAVLVNRSAASSSGTVPVHGTPGAHYVSISSACAWTLKVISYS
jgi:hypothetical protein